MNKKIIIINIIMMLIYSIVAYSFSKYSFNESFVAFSKNDIKNDSNKVGWVDVVEIEH